MSYKVTWTNNEGKVNRVFCLQELQGELLYRQDTRRVHLVADPAVLDEENVSYVPLAKLTDKELSDGKVFADFGTLKVEAVTASKLITNVQVVPADETVWRRSVTWVLVCMLLLIGSLVAFHYLTQEEVVVEEEEKEEIVVQIKPRMRSQDNRNSQTKKATPKKKSVKRMGALAVLGELSKSKSTGGIKMNAIKTSAGPGLGGGTKGSGGVQTSLYGKGVYKAPLGAGSNWQGAGGYGTKGKGGGQAGYGTMSMVGSSGTSTLPLSAEATVGGGLDRDAIAAVIRKNMGQIRFCYEQGLQGDAKLAGRVAVDFKIGANGRVKSAGIANTSLNSTMVENCIKMRLKTWKFPIPQGGKVVNVTYPFLLKRVGSG